MENMLSSFVSLFDTTSSSSSSQLRDPQRQCFSFASSSSISFLSEQKQFIPLDAKFVNPPPDWAHRVLLDCAHAIASNDSAHLQQLLWMLNELSSPFGDIQQRLAAYFLQAFLARTAGSGPRTHRALCAAAEKTTSFESARRTALTFQEASPWVTFGHVAANGAILDAVDGESRLHVVDVGSTLCTQWPTFLEALATRSSDDAPHVKLTSVVIACGANMQREVQRRLEKFARLMGVPFRFSVVRCDGNRLGPGVLDRVEIEPGEAVVVNCVGALRRLGLETNRDAFISAIARLHPKITTIVEEEADFGCREADGDRRFVSEFTECYGLFSAYMDSLETSLSRTSNECLALEREAGRAILDVISCPAVESEERRERAARWARRLSSAGFSPAPFSEDIADDVRALLRRHGDGWSIVNNGDSAGIFLAWKEHPVVWASAWKP